MKKKLKFADGETYEGETKNNQPHGEGTLINKNTKTKYIGKFKNGLRHGLGTIATEGLKLTGNWKNDQLPNKGKMEFPDGQIYEGGLKGGKYHGKGKLTLPDGTIVEAIFKESEMIKEIKKHNPKSEKLDKTIIKNLKFIIKNFAPKQMPDGKWVFKNPDKKIISQFKKDPELKELVTFFMSDNWKKFPDLIKKFSLKYNYKI